MELWSILFGGYWDWGLEVPELRLEECMDLGIGETDGSRSTVENIYNISREPAGNECRITLFSPYYAIIQH